MAHNAQSQNVVSRMGLRAATTALASAALLLASALVALAVRAQTYRVLYIFTGTTDGGNPVAGVVRDSAGNLYGTTAAGGDLSCTGFPNYLGCGIVFKIDPTGKETVLHTFTSYPDGATPLAGLVRDSAGNLYGTTAYGGDPSCPAFGCGTVFKIDASGNETILHTFGSAPDGNIPMAGLLRDPAGRLYGTTNQGGNHLNCNNSMGSGCGTIFTLDPTNKETVLYSFMDSGTSGDGGYPTAGPIPMGGALYGTAVFGGDRLCLGGGPGCGTLYKLDSTRILTKLYTFTGMADGAFPSAGLIADSIGNLYGAAAEGGDLNCGLPFGCGIVFKIDTTGHQTVLYTFTGGTDGAKPEAALLRDPSGNLYGTTYDGGSLTCPGGQPGCGTMFRLDPAGNETVLYRFAARGGQNPYGSLIRDAAGNLYGTAKYGGRYSAGVVFALKP